MKRIERLFDVLFFDDRRYVSLGCSLCNGPNVHVVFAQGAEHFTAQSLMALHIISDQGYNGKVFFNDDRLYLFGGNLEFESFVYGLRCHIHILVGNTYADGMLG